MKVPTHLDRYRIVTGVYASNPGDPFGALAEVPGPRGERLKILFDNGRDPDSPDLAGWEHVSVSCRRRTPTWEEMCWVKDQFWSEHECVVQFHPARVDYVNCHPHCLHLWRPIDRSIPVPPSWLVGPKA